MTAKDRINTLRDRHASLEKELEDEISRPLPDMMTVASIKRQKLRDIFNIDPRFKIPLIIAIGKPKEEIVIEAVGSDNAIRYWRDSKGVHHVPKRKLKDIIIASY